MCGVGVMKNYYIHDVKFALWVGGLIVLNVLNFLFILYVTLTKPSLLISINGAFAVILAFTHAMYIEELL